MTYRTLVDTKTLAGHLDDPDWRIVDCRFVLSDLTAGLRAYHAGHIPGAVYAHLEDDLSSPVTPDTGRHPLPNPKTLAEKLGGWGISNKSQVIVYDATFGAVAARLWWLLRWLGHEAVAVLDGDIRKWEREKRAITTELPVVERAPFHPTINNKLWVDTSHVEEIVGGRSGLIIDARAEERFKGEVEPFDKVAGHIPGAINVSFEDNLDFSGEFLSVEELREAYAERIGELAPADVVQMCGSGVTACHNALAMEHAGLAGSRVYIGSWSEWITDPSRPIVKAA